MTIYTHRITVEGVGEFPIDMLRYDCCFPDSEADSAAIVSDHAARRVVVTQATARKDPAFTPRRWESFGWKVIRNAD